MKEKRIMRILARVLSLLLVVAFMVGCSKGQEQLVDDGVLSNNILITETGDVIEMPSVEPVQKPMVGESELLEENLVLQKEEDSQKQEEAAPTPAVELDVPVPDQVITEEDQIDPQGNALQVVFLGDSIFDNNRDGTGIPYLTAVQCEADVFNLSIAGTSATIEWDESAELETWSSRSLCGVVNAMLKKIPTDIFAGTRTKELLDNSNIDFSQTDYFIVEYGTNDFFRAVRQSDSENDYNLKTYAGALRYGVSNLKSLAPDATIILCSPCYAQFYHNGYMVGDGNVTNPGNGTLFDYKGTCNYVANEMQVEFFNAYQDLGIDGYTAEEYLEDGVHLTEAGRKLYADALARRILSIEETKNN
mgnify:CR=1 FL=1